VGEQFSQELAEMPRLDKLDLAFLSVSERIESHGLGLQQLVSEGERTSFGLSCGAVRALVEVEVLVPVAPTLRFPLV
jgi:hypothetical protein